jgi:two-component system, chemotaxis family, response regulator Rcp1
MTKAFPSQMATFSMDGCHILLVEDNPAEARLFELAAREAGRGLTVEIVPDGDTALDYLFQRGAYANARRCALIVLDLNLPGRNGFDVLSKIRADSSTSTIPVIVLSGSASAQDVKHAYAEGANAYLRKPEDIDQMTAMAKSFVHYWCELVRLPDGRFAC